jgi:type IV fimbrial biogenesis protein FimT
MQAMVKHRRLLASGMTLVELLVAMTILALIGFAAVPDLTSTMANARIRSTTESLMAGMQRARLEAIRRNTAVTFSLMSVDANGNLDNSCAGSSTSAGWVVSIAAPDGFCGQAANDNLAPRLQFKQAPGGRSVALQVAGLGNDNATAENAVTFDGYGRVASFGSLGNLRRVDVNHVVNSNDTRPLRIEISNSGVIRMCEPRLDINGTDVRRCLAI